MSLRADMGEHDSNQNLLTGGKGCDIEALAVLNRRRFHRTLRVHEGRDQQHAGKGSDGEYEPAGFHLERSPDGVLRGIIGGLICRGGCARFGGMLADGRDAEGQP